MTSTEKGRGRSDETWLRMASKPEKLPPRSASLAFSNSASLSRGISPLRSSMSLLNVGGRHMLNFGDKHMHGEKHRHGDRHSHELNGA
jgi:hypothetical protein